MKTPTELTQTRRTVISRQKFTLVATFFNGEWEADKFYLPTGGLTEISGFVLANLFTEMQEFLTDLNSGQFLSTTF